MSPRVMRFCVWATCVCGVCTGAPIARLDVGHARAVGAAWALVHLSVLVRLLALPSRGAIRLPSLVSELVVLGAAPVILRVAAGAAGPALVLAIALGVINHVMGVRKGSWVEPALGNPWRLAPSLWHPALWLVAMNPAGSRGAWLGVALVPLAQAASVLVRSPNAMARSAGWVVWGGVGVVTVWALG